MTFPEIVKTTLWDIIDEGMSHHFLLFVKIQIKILSINATDFKKMMHLIISMESGSLNHELLKFLSMILASYRLSFYQQRSKLSVSAFRHLLGNLTLNSLRKISWKILSHCVMVLNFNIARNPNNPDTFHEPNGKSLSGFNMVHTISLYEVCSKRYLDLEVQPGRL